MNGYFFKINMKGNFISILLIVALFLNIFWVSAPASFAASNNIQVTLPSFKVTMNDEVANNDHSKYPLIVYKNITYFPMTYSDCRFLGIESTWTGNSSGLFIDSTGVTAAYNPYSSNVKNGKSYSATIPTFPISVNGKAIDNSKEQYPIILFRDITYFPMTWRFCVDQFGWDYKFDSNNGLVIKSTNAKLDQIPFSSFYGKESESVDYAVVGGNAYYINAGALYRQPGNESVNPKAEVVSVSITGDNREYLASTFKETSASKYRIMVFDKSGNAIFKTSDSGNKVTVVGNTLYFYNTTTKTYCRAALSSSNIVTDLPPKEPIKVVPEVDVKFNPANGTTDISKSVKPTILFAEAIETYSGNPVSSNYLRDTAIVFRENNANGTKVYFSASYNSSTGLLTITPDENLKDNQKYYIAIAGNTLRTQKDKTIISGSVTWSTKALAHTIAFHANGGIGTMASDTVNHGGNYTIKANAYIRSGYTFTGWNTAADGSGTAYNAGTVIKNVQSDTTLYAQWTVAASPYAISLSGIQSISAAYGYGSPLTTTTISINNKGSNSSGTGTLSIALSDTTSNFTLSTASISNIALGGSKTFNVTPKAGLSVGTYTTTVMVSGQASMTTQAYNISFTVSKAAPVVNWPTGLAALYGDPLGDIALPDNGLGTLGSFSWAEGYTASVGEVGERYHSLVFTPADAMNYNSAIQSIKITVKSFSE